MTMRREERPRPSVVTVRLDTEELEYLVAQYAYVEWDAVPEGERTHERHLVADLTQEGNAERTRAVLKAAWQEVCETLYPYVSEETVDGAVVEDSRGAMPTEFAAALRVPGGFSMTTARLIESHAKEYLCARVLSDWLGTTLSEAAAARWAARAEGARRQIRLSLVSRRRTGRRPMRPF